MKPRPKIIDRILDGMNESRTVCVVGHVRPDGDCVGSQLGLAYALQTEGKEVTCWNADPVPNKLAFLDPGGLLTRPAAGQRFDCVIATDAASLERLGSVAPCIADRGLFINIDHHASNTRFADINWVSAREPSTGELIYRLLREASWPVTPAIADCLFAAVSTDTGSFQYPSTRPATLHVAAELVQRGANLGRVCHEVYQSFPLPRVKLLRHVFNSFKLTHQNQIAYFWLRQRDYERTGAETADSEGLIDHIRSIEPVVIACVFEEVEPGMTRVSLRSKTERVNVSAIAERFGGGGHVAAAGARIPGSPLAAQRRVIAALKAALNSRR